MKTLRTCFVSSVAALALAGCATSSPLETEGGYPDAALSFTDITEGFALSVNDGGITTQIEIPCSEDVEAEALEIVETEIPHLTLQQREDFKKLIAAANITYCS